MRMVNKVDNFKLKLILSILSAIVFSFIFILLTFTVPTADTKKVKLKTKAKNRLEAVSKSMQK